MEKGLVCILCSAILPLFFSCSVKDDGQEIAAAPEISFAVPGMDVGMEGGIFEVGYNVENGTDGGILSPSAEGTDWIGDMRASDGILSFNVGANGSGESRTAVLTLVYSWDGGADTASVEIRQEAGNLWNDHTWDCLINCTEGYTLCCVSYKTEDYKHVGHG